MSFSFVVNGHAGTGMAGSSPEEVDAVKALITETLEIAKDKNLNLTVSTVSPSSWAPDVLNNLGD